MKGAIASVEIFVAEAGATEGQRRRLTLTVTAPERADDGEGWVCRVALADLHRRDLLLVFVKIRPIRTTNVTKFTTNIKTNYYHQS